MSVLSPRPSAETFRDDEAPQPQNAADPRDQPREPVWIAWSPIGYVVREVTVEEPVAPVAVKPACTGWINEPVPDLRRRSDPLLLWTWLGAGGGLAGVCLMLWMVIAALKPAEAIIPPA